MTRQNRLLAALLALTSVVALACTPETVRTTPTPSVAATTSARTATAAPTRTATVAPTTAAPTATPTQAPTTSPGSTPSSCPTLTGGAQTAGPLVNALRAAHQTGNDRMVFEFTGATVPGYEIKIASTFTAPSGQAVRVDGNAFFSVRVTGQAHNNAGGRSYPQADPYRPGLPLIREVKLVEDFEGQVIFGVGLERLACPTVLTLLSPPRIVLDFPTPP
jgi:hypothetical protein